MKIAITGTGGRVGAALAAYFSRRGDVVIELNRQAIDLRDLSSLPPILGACDFDVLINPAALSSPDDCEKNPGLAYLVNTQAPAAMAECCARRGKQFIHFSTDYVFGGEMPIRPNESDETLPVNVYGRSKRDGEIAALQACPEALVMRVSWVFGAEKPAFVEQIAQKIIAGHELEAVADKWSIPTWMTDLCEWTGLLSDEKISGIVHACHGGEPVSWHGLAVAVQELLENRGLIPERRAIAAKQLRDIDAFIARRPVHTAMDNARLCSLLPTPAASWCEALGQWFAGSHFSLRG